MIHAPPILTKELKLANLRRNNSDDFVFSDFENFMGKLNSHVIRIGLRFNDEVYYYLSRGLIDPAILEQLPTQLTIPSIIVAPSTLFSEAWESPDFKSFYH